MSLDTSKRSEEVWKDVTYLGGICIWILKPKAECDHQGTGYGQKTDELSGPRFGESYSEGR